MGARTFGDFDGDRRNNFDFLRFLLATLVIVSHSYGLLSPEVVADPLYAITRGQMTLSYICVNFFFTISGFLILASWERSPSAGDYFRKRILRIYPAILPMSLFCLFVVGPLGSPRGIAYLRGVSAVDYLKNLVLFQLPRQPSVFPSNPLPGVVNDSLWTIQFEFGCYVLVAVFGVAGILRRRGMVVALFLASYGLLLWQRYHGLAFLSGGPGLGGLLFSPSWPRFLASFAAGMIFRRYRDLIPYSTGLFVLSLAVVLLSFVDGLFATLPIFGSYALLWVAFARRLGLQNFARRGDLSYGMYLYAFPVQQLLIYHWPGSLTPTGLSLLACAITYILAVMSWHAVEKPFLRLKGRSESPQEQRRTVEMSRPS